MGLALVACGGEANEAPDASTLDWSTCGELECAVVQVPLDHDDPSGATLAIDVGRARAGDPDERIGVLLVNPGGPGGSGVGLASIIAANTPELAAVFDIVGWDPRGVGPSAELSCDRPLVDFYRLDNSPDTPAEAEALDAAASAVGVACARSDAELLAHIGTNDVVDDMDVIREALGEDRVSYLGFSYGTTLGLIYAERYGEHLRAAVLDGILDPRFTLEEWLTSQAIATETALTSILADNGGLADLTRLIDAADRGELLADDGAVSPSDVTRAAILATYDPSLHDRLRLALERAAAGDGTDVIELSNAFLNLASFDVYTAVSCQDNEHPTDAAGYDAFVDRIQLVAPVVGAAVANELRSCATWPVPVEPPSPRPAASNQPALLLLGNTGDSATPYADAVRVADRLDNATLVTFEGEGHTSFQEGSTCVDEAVETYLRTLELPAPDLVCR